jgi:hypothetical protein
MLSAYFFRSKARIGKALSYMLAAETVAIMITLVFSFFANGIYDVLQDQHAMVLRWVLFLTATGTSLHLAWCCRKVELEGVKDGDS